jgi:hypothetical protein
MEHLYTHGAPIHMEHPYTHGALTYTWSTYIHMEHLYTHGAPIHMEHLYTHGAHKLTKADIHIMFFKSYLGGGRDRREENNRKVVQSRLRTSRNKIAEG